MFKKTTGNLKYKRGVHTLYKHYPCRIFKNQENPEENQLFNFSTVIERLLPYFSFSKKELTRIANCIFHEILSMIREGKAVRIPYFGNFFGQFKPYKYWYNIGFNESFTTPKVHMRCYPNFYPCAYAVAVCSPKNTYLRPIRFLSTKSEFTQDAVWGLLEWHRAQKRFVKRSLMIHDNPYLLTGVYNNYRLKESTGLNYPSDTDETEIQDLLKCYKEEVYRKAKLLVKRLTRKDYFERGKHLYSYYNYLPGKYFVGSRNGFLAPKELQHLKAEDIVYRVNGNEPPSTDHLPDKAPDDFEYGNISQEYTPEATGFEDNLFDSSKIV